MRVVLTREASADLENVLSHIAANNPAAAARVAAAIDRTLQLLEIFQAPADFILTPAPANGW
jgi:plasmid stabilization system protein ParE